MRRHSCLVYLCFLVPFGGLISVSAVAQDSVKNQIYSLAETIQRDVYQSRATPNQLNTALGKLEEVLALLRSGNDPGPRVRFEVPNAVVVSGDNVQSSETAMRSWQSNCTQMGTFFREIVGTQRLESFSCGSPVNESPMASMLYYLYVASASAVVVSDGEVFEQAAGIVSGDNIQYDSDKAYQSWRNRCVQQLRSVKTQYAERFVAGSCGEVSNISPHATFSYYQYQSSPRVWIKRL